MTHNTSQSHPVKSADDWRISDLETYNITVENQDFHTFFDTATLPDLHPALRNFVQMEDPRRAGKRQTTRAQHCINILTLFMVDFSVPDPPFPA